MEGQTCIRQSFGWRCCGINRFLSLIALYSNNSVPEFFCNGAEQNFANKPLGTNMKNRARLAWISQISSSQSIGLIQKKVSQHWLDSEKQKKLIPNPQSRQQDLVDAKVGTSQSVLLSRDGLLECSIPTMLKPNPHCHLCFPSFTPTHISASWFTCPQGKVGCDTDCPHSNIPSCHPCPCTGSWWPQLHPRDMVPVTGALLLLGGDNWLLRTKPLPSSWDTRYGDTNSHK